MINSKLVTENVTAMNTTLIILLLASTSALLVGGLLGYYIRQSIAKKRAGTLEAKLQKRSTRGKTTNRRSY